jgi:signal transduction histidine kinase
MILFLVLFNSAGIFIIENIHKRSIDRTIKTVLDEHKGIEGTLYLNADLLQYDKNIGSQLEEWIGLVITGYIFSDKAEPNYLEIYDENKNQIFSNSQLLIKSPRSEIDDAKENERLFMIRKIDDKRYLSMSSKFKIQENTLTLVLIQNINFIYEERIQNYKLFIILDCFITIVLALGMYSIAKKVTMPIVRMSEVSKEIAQGNYKKRVILKNKKDEIGILADNFNSMIQATEDNIKELKYLNNAKQRFIDSLTHELKTPLTSIIGYSDLLLKGNVNEDVKFKALSYINSEAVRLEKLGLALLKLTLIKQNELSFNEVDLKHCVSTACKTLSYKLENKNIALKLNIQGAIITGDLQLIMVLIINLLDNAIKASLDFGAIEIIDNFDRESNGYVLMIKDYGAGIPEEDLDKIREPFYMVDKARDRANSGVGLGLAICDEICRVHNISLEIDSKIGEGTNVVLKFNRENRLL